MGRIKWVFRQLHREPGLRLCSRPDLEGGETTKVYAMPVPSSGALQMLTAVLPGMNFILLLNDSQSK